MNDFDSYNLDSDENDPVDGSRPNRASRRNAWDSYNLEDEDSLYHFEDSDDDFESENMEYRLDEEDDDEGKDDGEDDVDVYADMYDVEEEPAWHDDSNINYASAVRRGENAPSESPSSGNLASPFGILMKTMFTPVEGWKALKRAKIPSDKFAAKCFYPLIAIASLSEFAAMFYEANIPIVDMIVRVLMVFISFFFGYFSALSVAVVSLHSSVKETMKSSLGKNFIMLSMSTLAIFLTLFNLLPMVGPALVFLPIWTVYMIFRGVRILRGPRDKEAMTVVILSTLVIGMPLLWNWIFTELVPLSI